ncbi:hypothetical protein L1887_18226 [Cichorium endivia]|nr:hypothetical protein L1887_18226 [Cichorium endivia]
MLDRYCHKTLAEKYCGAAFIQSSTPIQLVTFCQVHLQPPPSDTSSGDPPSASPPGGHHLLHNHITSPASVVFVTHRHYHIHTSSPISKEHVFFRKKP